MRIGITYIVSSFVVFQLLLCTLTHRHSWTLLMHAKIYNVILLARARIAISCAVLRVEFTEIALVPLSIDTTPDNKYLGYIYICTDNISVRLFANIRRQIYQLYTSWQRKGIACSFVLQSRDTFVISPVLPDQYLNNILDITYAFFLWRKIIQILLQKVLYRVSRYK